MGVHCKIQFFWCLKFFIIECWGIKGHWPLPFHHETGFKRLWFQIEPISSSCNLWRKGQVLGQYAGLSHSSRQKITCWGWGSTGLTSSPFHSPGKSLLWGPTLWAPVRSQMPQPLSLLLQDPCLNLPRLPSTPISVSLSPGVWSGGEMVAQERQLWDVAQATPCDRRAPDVPRSCPSAVLIVQSPAIF